MKIRTQFLSAHFFPPYIIKRCRCICAGRVCGSYENEAVVVEREQPSSTNTNFDLGGYLSMTIMTALRRIHFCYYECVSSVIHKYFRHWVNFQNTMCRASSKFHKIIPVLSGTKIYRYRHLFQFLSLRKHARFACGAVFA